MVHTKFGQAYYNQTDNTSQQLRGSGGWSEKVVGEEQ